VRIEQLVAGRPWRVFRWRQGQAHYSGWYWSATTGGHVVYESRLELARLLLADFDPQVTAIAAQPFLLTAPSGGRTRRHVPDFLLAGRDGGVCVVNVKPADQLAVPAAQALGLWQAALYDQVARLERACGGQLVNRRPRPPGTAILTPLGQQLCQQARDYQLRAAASR